MISRASELPSRLAKACLGWPPPCDSAPRQRARQPLRERGQHAKPRRPLEVRSHHTQPPSFPPCVSQCQEPRDFFFPRSRLSSAPLLTAQLTHQAGRGGSKAEKPPSVASLIAFLSLFRLSSKAHAMSTSRSDLARSGGALPLRKYAKRRKEKAALFEKAWPHNPALRHEQLDSAGGKGASPVPHAGNSPNKATLQDLSLRLRCTPRSKQHLSWQKSAATGGDGQFSGRFCLKKSRSHQGGGQRLLWDEGGFPGNVSRLSALGFLPVPRDLH